MGDRGVDRNRQIAERQHRGGIGKVGELAADVQHAGIGALSCSASAGRNSRWMLMKLTPRVASNGSSWAKAIERLRSLKWSARPDQAIAMRGAGHALRCARASARCAARSRAGKEARPARSKVRSCSASGRLASGQCRSKGGSGSPRPITDATPSNVREQFLELRLHLEHDLGAGARQHRRVAHELDGVAQTLLGMQQDGLARQRGFAEPGRAGETAAWHPFRCVSSATRIFRSRAGSRRW